ncbi:unnamed protein product [Moneuplotes crassus]|uniref:TRP C-terminal domain-containing protein n=1 Tax=Euplotes crassus TaxID=5936 RepID=A0AAD1UAW4_EUPCR|nr:unnamed protein product [Moneuplotes crassus]
MLKNLLPLLLAISVVALPDNDNFVLYADDIGGYPVVSSDGYLFLIASNITKINLETKASVKEIEIYSESSNTQKITHFRRGVLSNDESLLLLYSTSLAGPHCAEILVITTTDMVMKQDNCFKVDTDNVFGPTINDIKPLSSSAANGSNIFYAVGNHLDFIISEHTSFLLQFEVLDTYITNILKYKILSSNFQTSGLSPGIRSFDFNKDFTNMLVSGIIKDSTTEYITVFSITRDLNTVNWMKYISKKTSSVLNVTSLENLSRYDSGNDQVVICSRLRHYNATDYTDKDYVYMYALKASDGSLNWEVQFEDYASNRVRGLDFAIHSGFNQLILMNTNSKYSYYHSQAISLADGSFVSNVQFDILFHYQTAGIAKIPDGNGTFESNDYVLTTEGGYIFKINSRKANLASATDSSLFYPLNGIYYDNYSFPKTSPADFELLSYSPSSDFFQDKTEHEVKEASYTYKQVEVSTLKLVSEVSIGFNTTEGCSSSTPAGLCQEEDTKIIPNTGSFNLNKPYTKDGLKDSVMEVTFQLFEFSDLVNPISSSLYSFTKQDGNYTVKLAGLPDGSYLARAVAKADPHHTYYEFTLIVKCISNCKTCSENDVCDVCDNGYVLDYARQCVSGGNEIIDGNIIQGLGAAMVGGMLITGAMQGTISPNVWVMINTLQILRTILLLKVNIPLAVRQTIESSSVLAALDIGLYNLLFPEPDEDASIMKIMDGDELLGQYFEDYGIETYRFIDYTFATLVDVIFIFITTTLLMAGLSYLYLKLKKKDTSVVIKKLKFIFFANGFVRIYLEIMLDGIIYSLVNLRSVQFNGVFDAFSYITLFVFVLLVIGFNSFIVFYATCTEMSKWSHKFEEILTETPMTKGGVVAYHMTFTLRRVALSINIIMLGVLDPNIHITFHVLVQAITIQVMLFYPMFENRFQKVSNLIMEVSILYIFASVYIFQNSKGLEDEAKVLALFILFSSQFLLMLMTISKSIREMLIEWKERKARRRNNLPTSSVIVDQMLKDDSSLKFSLREETKMQLSKSEYGKISPMKKLSDFDEIASDKDINSRISAAFKKSMQSESDHSEVKKSRLSKLLHKIRMKKEASAKKAEKSKKKKTRSTQKHEEDKKYESSSDYSKFEMEKFKTKSLGKPVTSDDKEKSGSLTEDIQELAPPKRDEPEKIPGIGTIKSASPRSESPKEE